MQIKQHLSPKNDAKCLYIYIWGLFCSILQYYIVIGQTRLYFILCSISSCGERRSSILRRYIVAKSGCIVIALVLVCSDTCMSQTENGSIFVCPKCCCERHEKRISELLNTVESLKSEIIRQPKETASSLRSPPQLTYIQFIETELCLSCRWVLKPWAG